MMTDNDVARAFSQLADIILAEAEANYPTEDLGYEDLGYEDLGYEDLGYEDLGYEDLGYEDLGYEDLGYENFQDLQYRLGFDLS